MKTVYAGGTILNDEFKFVKTNLLCCDGTITALCDDIPECDNTVDCKDKYIVPGFIDIHTHGALGLDSADGLSPDEFDKLSMYYASKGVTTFLPTIATNSIKGTEKAVNAIKTAYEQGTTGANIGGIYLEGPYFSTKYKGAQNEAFIRTASIEEFDSLSKLSNGLIKIISIAPETQGAQVFTKHASKSITVAVGHTDADYDCGKRAINDGATLLTHSFNAMRPIHHREPGAISAFFESDAMCEFIFDGIHVSPVVIALIYKLIGADRMTIVSDSISAAGMPDGKYELCGQQYYVKDGKARFENGTIVGSTSNLHESVKNAISFGIPIEDAIKMASLNPAIASRIDNICGSIISGKRADLVILNKEYDICDVVVKGVLTGGN